MIMLEIGNKCDTEHDLALFELAVKYCQQKDTLEELFDDSTKIKIKEQINFIKYITESPDGKDTKISNALPEGTFKRFIHPLVILNRDLMDGDASQKEAVEMEIKQLELAIGADKHKDKIDLLKEQFIENDKLLQKAISLQNESQKEDTKKDDSENEAKNEKYIYLKTLYVVFYKLLLEELFKQLGLEEVEYNIFFSNSIVPYYTNELSACEMNSSNVKRIISMLEEKDKKQLLNIMGVEDIEKLGDQDFI